MKTSLLLLLCAGLLLVLAGCQTQQPAPSPQPAPQPTAKQATAPAPASWPPTCDAGMSTPDMCYIDVNTLPLMNQPHAEIHLGFGRQQGIMFFSTVDGETFRVQFTKRAGGGPPMPFRGMPQRPQKRINTGGPVEDAVGSEYKITVIFGGGKPDRDPHIVIDGG